MSGSVSAFVEDVVVETQPRPWVGFTLLEAGEHEQERQREFVSYLKNRGLGEMTARSYTGDVAQFLAWCKVRGVLPGDITREDAGSFVGGLCRCRAGENPGYGAGYSSATIARKVSSIRRFYAMLSERESGLACPFGAPRDYGIRRGKGTRRKTIPAESIIRVLLAPSPVTPAGIRDRAILALIINGLGLDEIHRLNTTDMDLSVGRLLVEGRARKVRSVILLPEASIAVRTWMNARALTAHRDSALFVSLHHNTCHGEPGRRLSTRGLRQAVDRSLRLAGHKRPGISARVLRISGAAAALTAGALLGDIAAMTGVSSRTARAYKSILTQSVSR